MSSNLPNPLIPGFNPDPSCVRVDGVYYLVTSSFEYMPGIPIYRSTDFATWEHIANVATRPSQTGVATARSGMGVWAPTIRHHDGLFQVIVTVARGERGCVLFTAEDPAGPWSDGLTISGVDGIDPDLAWDEHGVAYVTYSALRLGGEHAGRHDGIEQVAVDLDTGAVLAGPASLWSGTGLQFPEAPHVYRRGEYWYLLIAEGGTERGHAVSVARGRSISGPFDGHPANPILRASGTTRRVQNTGHADLVHGPDGTDLLVLLGVRPLGAGGGFSPLGRETFVTPVEWVDGWPVAAAVEPTPRAAATVEEFALSSPDELADPGWLAVGRNPGEVGRIADGALVIAGVDGGLDQQRPAFIGRRQRHLTSSVRVRVHPGSGAGGLGLRYDEQFHITLTARRERDEVRVNAAAVAGLRQTWTAVVPGSTAVLSITTHLGDPAASHHTAGGERIVLAACGEDGHRVELAALDGRFWSAETAASFTGRATGPFAEAGTVRFTDFRYWGKDGSTTDDDRH